MEEFFRKLYFSMPGIMVAFEVHDKSLPYSYPCSFPIERSEEYVESTLYGLLMVQMNVDEYVKFQN